MYPGFPKMLSQKKCISHYHNCETAEPKETSLSVCPKNFLQSIHKLWILTIGKIQPFLVFQLDVRGRSTDSSSLFVLSLAVPVDEEDIDDAGGPAYNLWKKSVNLQQVQMGKGQAYNNNLSRNISWCIFRTESLRTDDVTCAVTNQV